MNIIILWKYCHLNKGNLWNLRSEQCELVSERRRAHCDCLLSSGAVVYTPEPEDDFGSSRGFDWQNPGTNFICIYTTLECTLYDTGNLGDVWIDAFMQKAGYMKENGMRVGNLSLNVGRRVSLVGRHFEWREYCVHYLLLPRSLIIRERSDMINIEHVI